MKKSVILSNLQEKVSPYALSSRPVENKWRPIPYETEEFSGVMLAAAAGAHAPSICIDPGLKGWYHVFIGSWKYGFGQDHNMTRYKLSGDKVWRCINAGGGRAAQPEFQEFYLDSRKMDGQSLCISQPDWNVPCSSCVAYFRFVPMAAGEVEALEADRARKDTRRLLGTHDVHAMYSFKRCDKVSDFLEEIEPYRNSDYEKLLFEYLLGGDSPESPFNELNWVYGSIGECFPRPGDENYCRNVTRLKASGINPNKIMTDYAHELGLKMYMSYRMNAFAAEPPFDTIFNTFFYDRNPELRCSDREGREICRMSYAYREVQDRIIAFFIHMCEETGCDGIGMLFNRCFPYVCYEAPAVELCRKKYGVDPRTLPPDDARWLDCKREIMTGFIRRTREALDAYSRRMGLGRIAIAVYLLADEQENRMYGLDGKLWAEEGLIDDIVAHPLGDDLEGRELKSRPLDLDYYAGLYQEIKHTGVKLYCDIMPRYMEPEEYRRRALEIYDKGLENIAMWDSYQRHWNQKEWTMSSYLGHEEELRAWRQKDAKYRAVPCLSMGGYRVDRYSPGWGL